MRGEREECAAEDAGYAAGGEPSPAVGSVANTQADGEGTSDGYETRGRVKESRVGGGETKGLDQSCGVCRHYAA